MRDIVEEFSSVLKIGFHCQRHWPEYLDELRVDLVRDFVASLEVYDLQRLLKANPELPAIDAVAEDEILTLHALSTGCKKSAALDMKKRLGTFLVELAGSVGFFPSKSQAMPGTEKVWTGWKYLKIGVAAYRLMKDTDR